MTISDDLRAAAFSLFMLESDDSPPELLDLRKRLRAHADTIERVEREIDNCDPAMLNRDNTDKWANALRGDSNGK